MAAILFITDGPKAQLSRSPYTILGVGETQGMGLSNHEAMGGVGIAYGRPYHINNINPALLPMNVVTSFDIAAMGDRRVISSDTLNQRNASINYWTYSYLMVDLLYIDLFFCCCLSVGIANI